MFLYCLLCLSFVVLVRDGKLDVLACNSGASSSTFARADQAMYMRHMMQLLKDTAPGAAASTDAPQYDYGTDYYYATDGGQGAGAATTTPAAPNVQTPLATNPPQPLMTPAIQPTTQPLVASTQSPNHVVNPPLVNNTQPGGQNNWHYNEVQVRSYPSYPCCPYMLPSNPCCQSITVQIQMNNFCTYPQNCAMYG